MRLSADGTETAAVVDGQGSDTGVALHLSGAPISLFATSRIRKPRLSAW